MRPREIKASLSSVELVECLRSIVDRFDGNLYVVPSMPDVHTVRELSRGSW
jgi:hypothetical protein